MRTTLEIDDEVLQAAKELARRENKTVGQVVSELLRHALAAPSAAASGAARELKPADGFKPFARRGGIVTNALVDQLRTSDAY